MIFIDSICTEPFAARMGGRSLRECGDNLFWPRTCRPLLDRGLCATAVLLRFLSALRPSSLGATHREGFSWNVDFRRHAAGSLFSTGAAQAHSFFFRAKRNLSRGRLPCLQQSNESRLRQRPPHEARVVTQAVIPAKAGIQVFNHLSKEGLKTGFPLSRE